MKQLERYNLFLDDIRMPLDAYEYTRVELFASLKWTIVRNFTEFTQYIAEMYSAGYFPSAVSFSHDLADGHYRKNMQEGKLNYSAHEFNDDGNKTGYHCAEWLIEFCIIHKLTFPLFYVHSMNPVGKENIKSVIESYLKSVEN